MKIVSVEAVPLAVSFKRTFRFGTTDRSTSPNVVLVVRTDDGQVGYGEAFPVPAFTSETQASVIELVGQRVAPVLMGQDPTRRGPLQADLAKVLKFAPFTTAAVDTALLDLTGRTLGVPVSTLLGRAFRDRVEVHGSVGWDEDPACMVDIAVRQAATYRSLKTYAGRGDVDADLDRLQAVRDAVGPGVGLFVDVNGLWSPSDLLRALRRHRRRPRPHGRRRDRAGRGQRDGPAPRRSSSPTRLPGVPDGAVEVPPAGPRAHPRRDWPVPWRDVEPGRRPVSARPRHGVLGGQGAAPGRHDGVRRQGHARPHTGRSRHWCRDHRWDHRGRRTGGRRRCLDALPDPDRRRRRPDHAGRDVRARDRASPTAVQGNPASVRLRRTAAAQREGGRQRQPERPGPARRLAGRPPRPALVGAARVSLQRLAGVVPALDGVPVARRWGGLVDMTPDGLPIVDANTGLDGLVIVTGLCGHGFTLGPALGETATDLALAGRTNRDLEAFALARFTLGRAPQPAMMI